MAGARFAALVPLPHAGARQLIARFGPLTLLLVILGGSISAGYGQDAPFVPPSRELVIGTKSAPPFAIKAPDGTWRGLSIDLWRRIAEQMHLRYRFQEATLSRLVDGVADGSLDLSVAAISVTASRLHRVDFTQPFYSSGLGIAVAKRTSTTWQPIIDSIFTMSFLRAVLMLFAIALVVGVAVWLIEHRHNEHFGMHHRGFGSSLWWSAATMTQSGASGEKVPVTLPGRLLAIGWMVASVIVVACFTAALTSQLTLKQLLGKVHGESDLRYSRAGAIISTETIEYLDREQIVHRDFASVDAGLDALRRGKIDALIYDRPLLLWVINDRFADTLQVLDATFDPQVYAIALPKGSELRNPINVALLDAIQSDWWRRKCLAYLGHN